MDSFYAFTSTSVESPLENRLEPGRYKAALKLADTKRGIKAESGALPFEVAPGPDTVQDPAGLNRVGDAVENADLPPWIPFAGAAALVLVLAVGFLLGRRQPKG